MAGGRESRLNGLLEKGRRSVGVARRHPGTAGRVENGQMGVFAAYARRWGRALIDRRLYPLRHRAEDEDRRARASVPPETAFAPKPAPAREMIARALDAGLRWTTEQAFRRARDELGLDHCEARSRHGRHRHVTLVMAAAAHLAELSADRRRHAFGEGDKTSPAAAAA